MSLTLTLTDAEFERVREMALLDSYAEAVEICGDRLTTDAQIQAVKDDVVDWNKVRVNVTDLVPTSQSELSLSREKKRRLLRWGMRDRLGLPPVSEKEIEMDALGDTSGGIQRGTLRLQTGRKSNRSGGF